ncbi:hypothetical protein KCP78_13380 [Salmonella enterica subsp. enterica]|nr:hypothetical protein KCP78_13380 [Salmonella enterica subsp. enterica]
MKNNIIYGKPCIPYLLLCHSACSRFEGRSPIAIRDIPVFFASGCGVVYLAFAHPAYRLPDAHSRFRHSRFCRRCFYRAHVPLASQSAYHWLLYKLKE